jgi:hypothetical protein
MDLVGTRVTNTVRKGHSPLRERMVPRGPPALGCEAGRRQGGCLPRSTGPGDARGTRLDRRDSKPGPRCASRSARQDGPLPSHRGRVRPAAAPRRDDPPAETLRHRLRRRPTVPNRPGIWRPASRWPAARSAKRSRRQGLASIPPISSSPMSSTIATPKDRDASVSSSLPRGGPASPSTGNRTSARDSTGLTPLAPRRTPSPARDLFHRRLVTSQGLKHPVAPACRTPRRACPNLQRAGAAELP